MCLNILISLTSHRAKTLISFTYSTGSLLFFLPVSCLFVPVMVALVDPLAGLFHLLSGEPFPGNVALFLRHIIPEERVSCAFAWNWNFFPFLELWEAYKTQWDFQNFRFGSAKPPIMWQSFVGCEGNRGVWNLLNPAFYFLARIPSLGTVWNVWWVGWRALSCHSDREGTSGILRAGTWCPRCSALHGESCISPL